MSNPVASPQSVLDLITAFEAQPISSFGDASLQTLGNGIYNLGLSAGLAQAGGQVAMAQVVADLQALEAADQASINALITKYSPAPSAPASS